MNYTEKQGQYLAFIYHYPLLNRCAPAEFDFQMYFRVSAPTVHQMIVTLDRKGFISRTPGQGRSIVIPRCRACGEHWRYPGYQQRGRFQGLSCLEVENGLS